MILASKVPDLTTIIGTTRFSCFGFVNVKYLDSISANSAIHEDPYLKSWFPQFLNYFKFLNMK